LARPILITGIPRCGTSWVGKMLDASGAVVYINEPLNDRHPPGRSPGVLAAPVQHRFQYITGANELPFLEAFKEMLGLRYHALAELRANCYPRNLVRMAKYWNSFVRGRVRGRRPLLDDPFAVFSTEWFARRLDCQVIVVVRHPAAIAASRKRLGWRTDFRHLLNQPLLLEEWLHPFEPAMRAMVRKPDWLGESALLWRMIYHLVGELRGRLGGMRVVRHEDLSLDPVGGYVELFAELGLPLSARTRRVIDRASSGGSEDAGHAWSVSMRGASKTGFRPLDSRAHAVTWKTSLAVDEISRIRAATEDVASLYYRDRDWS
jgi:sulfotransferase family protein